MIVKKRERLSWLFLSVCSIITFTLFITQAYDSTSIRIPASKDTLPKMPDVQFPF